MLSVCVGAYGFLHPCEVDVSEDNSQRRWPVISIEVRKMCDTAEILIRKSEEVKAEFGSLKTTNDQDMLTTMKYQPWNALHCVQ